MRLLHLSAVGPDVPTATLEFAPRLTVVYGASEAGKSYVIEALDYMFGASQLRDIPEAAGYRAMLLGIDFGGDDVVTLARSLRGGPISAFDEDIRSLPDRPGDRQLAAKHRKDATDTISYFLLDRLGVADAKLRKNSRNEVVAMSFRNIAHLVLVDEERMQSRTSPVETGIPATRTVERSALKLLLEGDDDSGLGAGQDPAAFSRVNRAQLEVLDRAITQVRTHLYEAPEQPERLDLFARVNASIQQASASISTGLAERDLIVARRDELQAEQRRQNVRASEAITLFNRFSLLDAQYQADLARLQMVKDAGTLLGYFDAEACVFCGASAEHQQREHAVYETVQLAESVDAETSRTRALRTDLASTLTSIQAAQARAQELSASLGADIAAATDQVDGIARRMLPAQRDLDQLIARRSQLERWLGLWQQVTDLEGLRASVAQEKPLTADPVADGVGVRTGRDFSSDLRRVLVDWGVPRADEAGFRFDAPPDVVLQDRRRADRGKGMRSVLHAGFSIALSEYCLERDLPHPGFVALDTPVLTYRDADAGQSTTSHGDIRPDSEGEGRAHNAEDELMSTTVAQAFYDYLATTHPGQTLVLENQTPPSVDTEGCKILYFTGSAAHGRAGFYPAST
ncbi:hypothetical protein [Jiangella alkaliphila]|uniref:AAA domain-containing protein n=1 Tax=Jiangella alkaliphila TaxID=419479 RepID=A0A1H2H006_9ACTN|nr:hypothetical protein [Jiangella alkaliphila]SDU25131.1 hypothetical protein SAMN04488563_0766 [Jiangella alkaliphila]